MRRFDPARRLQILHLPAPDPPRRPLYPGACGTAPFDHIGAEIQYHRQPSIGDGPVFCLRKSCLVSFTVGKLYSGTRRPKGTSRISTGSDLARILLIVLCGLSRLDMTTGVFRVSLSVRPL